VVELVKPFKIIISNFFYFFKNVTLYYGDSIKEPRTDSL